MVDQPQLENSKHRIFILVSNISSHPKVKIYFPSIHISVIFYNKSQLKNRNVLVIDSMIQSYFLYPSSPFHYKEKRATERHAYAMKETKLIPKET